MKENDVDEDQSYLTGTNVNDWWTKQKIVREYVLFPNEEWKQIALMSIRTRIGFSHNCTIH